jgi:hypothetical protein
MQLPQLAPIERAQAAPVQRRRVGRTCFTIGGDQLRRRLSAIRQPSGSDMVSPI